MAKKIVDTPFDKRTTKHILAQEMPEVDLVEISGAGAASKTKKQEQMFEQSMQAYEQSQFSTQLRDIKEIQMNAYSTGGLVATDQVSVGATICSIFATILLTIAVIIGLLYGMMIALNLSLVAAKDGTLAPQVPENCLLVMEKVESYNDIFEEDIVTFNGDNGIEVGFVFWPLEPTSSAPEGNVLIITTKEGMENYNFDIENNSKKDPSTSSGLAEARTRYFLEQKSVHDVIGKLSFQVSSIGGFVVFVFDNWYIVLIALALVVILLFLLKAMFDKRFEAELFRQMELANSQRNSTREMLKKDLIRTQKRFSENFATSQDMFELLDDSKQELEKPAQLDPRKARVMEELQNRKRAQIEQLQSLAEKTQQQTVNTNDTSQNQNEVAADKKDDENKGENQN